ncbi:anti-sigma factor [Nesterenkonia sp. E16_7]|uniref:anti-sigma factor domain-containing protein n=1 Tax=unclassified Nesterenkonia TaxID=2629769 RepID=UPI001A91ED59|nr:MULTISPECIES: anti-sigma factor [unclassified Nesterenkonia]MBO0596916.1 anti-sigma factor [Nesterenkonia sp. E16_10]MBO0598130.1 anti-sigma factor [Nesterenkonia sp. E16_7]
MNADREYLAAGLALGTLADAEMLEALDLEAADPDFAEAVASFHETLGLLSETDDAIAPSAETSAAILNIPRQHQQAVADQAAHPADPTADDADETAHASIPHADTAHVATPDSTTPDSTTPVSTAPARRRRPSTALFALAASTLLLISAVLAGALINQQQDTSQIEESLTVAEAERERAERLLSASDLAFIEAEATVGGQLSLAYSVSEQMLHLTPRDMPELDEDQTMQLWLIDEEGPRSAGLMTGASTELLTDLPMTQDMTFGVTVEPAGGSEEPTSDPVVLADL